MDIKQLLRKVTPLRASTFKRFDDRMRPKLNAIASDTAGAKKSISALQSRCNKLEAELQELRRDFTQASEALAQAQAKLAKQQEESDENLMTYVVGMDRRNDERHEELLTLLSSSNQEASDA